MLPERRVTPKSIVLDLVRVTPEPGSIPVRSLVEVGALFRFTHNTSFILGEYASMFVNVAIGR